MHVSVYCGADQWITTDHPIYRPIYIYTFCLVSMSLSFSDQAITKNSPNRKKGITTSVICENFSPVYRIVSEKLSLKKLQSLKKCMSSLTFLLPNNFAISNGGYFLCCCLQRAKNCTKCSN